MRTSGSPVGPFDERDDQRDETAGGEQGDKGVEEDAAHGSIVTHL
ncbi:MAG: hypothetical protein ACRCY9_11295 [Phycicoccus sp.]